PGLRAALRDADRLAAGGRPQQCRRPLCPWRLARPAGAGAGRALARLAPQPRPPCRSGRGTVGLGGSGRAGRLAGAGSFARRAGLLARRLARAAGAAPGPGAAPLAGYPGLAHAHRSPPAGLVAPAARSPRAGSRSERATAPRRRLDRGAARPCLLPMENPGRIIRFAGSPGFTLRQGNMLVVQKYGGTSMGSVERIQNVARRVAKWHAAGHQVVVVPSAMAGETSRLLGLAKEISPQPDLRELDRLAATGEQASSALLAIALMRQGVAARSYAGWQVPVRTDSAYTKARIRSIDDTR